MDHWNIQLNILSIFNIFTEIEILIVKPKNILTILDVLNIVNIFFLNQLSIILSFLHYLT